MAKVQILDINGGKKGELTTEIFDGTIRKDIVQKIVEIEKLDEKQPYAPFMWAGMQTSASGNVKHNRHVWKTDRGKGVSRYPKKRMSDKGSHFVWVAAAIPGVRKGRRAHPPKLLRADSKINKKEKILGFASALAMVASIEELKSKYSRLSEAKESDIKMKLPLVVDSKILSLKTKDFISSLEKILGKNILELALQEKKVRAGRGKMRNRRYKQNAGMLLIIGNEESKQISGIDVRKIKELKLKDLADNGARLVMFTESAVKGIESRMFKKDQKEAKK